MKVNIIVIDITNRWETLNPFLQLNLNICQIFLLFWLLHILFFLDCHANFISLEYLSILFFWALPASNLYSLFTFQQFVIHLCLHFNSLLFISVYISTVCYSSLFMFQQFFIHLCLYFNSLLFISVYISTVCYSVSFFLYTYY